MKTRNIYLINVYHNFIGKAESIWDRVVHTRQELFIDDLDLEEKDAHDLKTNDIKTSDKTFMYALKGIPVYRVKYEQNCEAITGDIACNSYYKLDEDVDLLCKLGVSVII